MRRAVLVLATALVALAPFGVAGGDGPVRLVVGVGSLDDPLVERDVRNLQYPPLVALAADTLDPIPAVAEAWSPAVDGDGWTYTIRGGLAWSDGTPVTSADVVASLDRQRGAFPGIAVVALDDRRVTLSGADNPTVLLNVVPAHAPDANPPVTSGDWQVTERTEGEITMRAVERPGRPRVDEIVFREYAGADDLLDALDRGDIDVAADVPPERYDDLLDVEDATAIHANDGDQWIMRVGVEDQELRQAIARSVDRGDLVSAVAHGVGRASPVPIVARGQRWRLADEEQRALSARLAYAPEADTFGASLTLGAPSDETGNAIAAFVRDALAEIGIDSTIATDRDADVTIVRRDATDDPRAALEPYTCAAAVWCHLDFDAAFETLTTGDFAQQTDAVHEMVHLLATEGTEVALFEPDILQGFRTDHVTGLLREPRTERLVVLWPSAQQYAEAVPTSTLGGERIPDAVFAAIATGVGVVALALVFLPRMRASGTRTRATRSRP